MTTWESAALLGDEEHRLIVLSMDVVADSYGSWSEFTTSRCPFSVRIDVRIISREGYYNDLLVCPLRVNSMHHI
jgi:hypothetical protein